MADFEEYEQEFLGSIRQATTLIGKSNYASDNAEANSALGAAQENVVAARAAFKQMKLAAASNASRRVQLRPKLAQYKKSLESLEMDLQRAERSGLFGSGTSDTHSGDAHRDRLADNTRRLQKQKETLQKTTETLANTQDVALNVMDELARNRQTIKSARGKTKKMMGGTDRARWIVSDMIKRNTKTKLFVCFIFLLVLALIGILIWQVTKAPDSPTPSPTPAPTNSPAPASN